ncbi:hypothetical protein SAMN02745161_3031 [Halodesulfovibrio marinisediminis DSM 17456]|uniref:Uncharacterized protein n=1 Tax=Halodesulfovibrio marinisediminis DSM 17456 TaxID=1121457 RepID=A0A1N6IXG4_9BACT|nr:hypothetical protein SAMN02745161_3031 [Halodesulfovibrio marinisediminis DSM 17456]
MVPYMREKGGRHIKENTHLHNVKKCKQCDDDYNRNNVTAIQLCIISPKKEGVDKYHRSK